MKRIAIIQSNYIPWKGYFDIIDAVDEFIIYDECQYTRRDWRNRNKIKTPNGTAWMTIPVRVRGKYTQPICETEIDGDSWVEKHLSALHHNYAKAPFYSEVRPLLERMYADCQGENRLSMVNHRLLSGLCELLGIDTPLLWSMDIGQPGCDAQIRILEICRARGADVYLSGPAARSYLVQEEFDARDIGLEWMDYSHYPEYPQSYPPFEHAVSAVDVFMHMGVERARNHVCLFRHARQEVAEELA